MVGCVRLLQVAAAGRCVVSHLWASTSSLQESLSGRNPALEQLPGTCRTRVTGRT